VAGGAGLELRLSYEKSRRAMRPPRTARRSHGKQLS
jgi:hypothetical protein